MLFSTQAKGLLPSSLTSKDNIHLSDLPPEVIEQIIFYVVDIPTLFHLLTASRVTSRAAEAALYHTIDLTSLHNGPMEHAVFNHWSRLLRHLIDTQRHASMVFYVHGSMKRYTVEFYVKKSHHGGLFNSIVPTRMELNFQLLPAKLPQLRQLVIPRDNDPLINATIQFSSNVLRELEIYSSVLYSAAHPQRLGHAFPFLKVETLNSIVSRQKELRLLKVNPQSFAPFRPKLSERTQPLWTLPFQIEAVEGSLWLLKDVLPPSVLPRRLRFWDSMDPFTESVTISPTFWEQLGRLPMLHTLEIIITAPGDSAVAIWMTSKFAACLRSSEARVRELVVTMPSFQSKHLASLLGYLSDLAFEEIESLLTLEVGAAGEEYLRAMRENRLASSGGVKREDWWVYV
ncbi:hypothetical protein DL96DRAFT_375294 [Flagelloscypha sp. PMI_526]|nr:hypothetical protein DL96DRAFT_375294 [Flagelloscypha sp. PMI_526]